MPCGHSIPLPRYAVRDFILILFRWLGGWHAAFWRAQVRVPLRRRSGWQPRAPSPPGCLPWEGCPAACSLPGPVSLYWHNWRSASCDTEPVTQTPGRTDTVKKKFCRWASIGNKWAWELVLQHFLQVHQLNKTPRISIHSGHFPDRYLVGKRFLGESLWEVSMASTGLVWCSAGSWLLSQHFPSLPKGNHKG